MKERKKCPFLKKLGRRHYGFDFKCVVTSIWFNNPTKFSKEHGCLNLIHKNCEHFLEAMENYFWLQYLEDKEAERKARLRELYRQAYIRRKGSTD